MPKVRQHIRQISLFVSVKTNAIELLFDKSTTRFTIKNLLTDKTAVASVAPVAFDKDAVKLSLKENPDEYFYGGGVQNGRFSHKGNPLPSKIKTAGPTAEWLHQILFTGLPTAMVLFGIPSRKGSMTLG